MRLAYVDFDGARCMAAAEAAPSDKELDERFLQMHCGTVLEAVDRICEWLKKGR
jgi:aspartate aminotransferase